MVKFLIIRFSSIGDIILTSPVIRCLKEQVEDSEIHFLTKAQFEPILTDNPYIDKIHTLQSNFSQISRQLKKEKFDFIIDLHNNLRTLRFKLALKRVAFTFRKLNARKWLMVNFKINKLPNLHIVDRYMESLRVFSVTNDMKGLDYYIPKGEQVDLKILLPDLKSHFVCLVVGGGHFTKQIPAEKIKDLIQNTSMPVLLLGGKEDVLKAREIENGVNRKLYNLAGHISVNQAASVIQQSSLVITPDTGMMHIAAAFHKKIFSLWGNTIPDFGMTPYMPEKGSEIFEVTGLPCRPCTKIGYRKCPKKHFKCMNNQNYLSIYQSINKCFDNSKT